MAWNEPGNRGKDPWGNNGGKKQGPPDLDDILKYDETFWLRTAAKPRSII